MKDVAVRASAGSGKTYELAVQFIARLVLGADPGSIVATTFTRNAAGEILDRIIQRLASAAASTDEADILSREILRIVPEPGGPLSSELWLNLLIACCQALDRMNIGTIDSLFVRALAAFQYEAGLIAPPRMGDERSPEAEAIRTAALQETLAGMSAESALEMLRDLSGGLPARSVLPRMEQAVSELLPLASVTAPSAWGALAPIPEPDPDELDDAMEQLERIASACGSRALAKGLLKSVADARGLQWEAVLTTGASGKVGLSLPNRSDRTSDVGDAVPPASSPMTRIADGGDAVPPTSSPMPPVTDGEDAVPPASSSMTPVTDGEDAVPPASSSMTPVTDGEDAVPPASSPMTHIADGGDAVPPTAAPSMAGTGSAGASPSLRSELNPTYMRVRIPDEAIGALRTLTQAAAHHIIARLLARSKATRALLDRYSQIYGGLLRRADMLLFDELPRVLLEATSRARPADIHFRLGLSVRHVLLDEFQDTSQPQWAMLQRLLIPAGAESPRPSIFCVGDSKQAIYGWRGGCAAIFDRLEREVPGVVWETRSTSYRSSQVVLDLVNEVFGNIERWDGILPYPDLLAQWKNQYIPHQAHFALPGHTVVRRHTPVGAADRPLPPFQPPSDAGGSSSSMTPIMDDETDETLPPAGLRPFEAWVTSAIADIARHDTVSTIGVLVRRNRTAANIAFGLQSLGIAASLDGPGALADDPAVAIILSALRLADHPDSTAEAFHVAASPLRDALGLLDLTPAMRRRVSLRVRRMLAAQGYAKVIAQWSRILAPMGDERTGRRLTQLTEAAAAYEPQTTQRPSDFVRWVLAQTVSERSDERIRVMSIHQAKGLEFDIVVLPELHAPIHAVRPPVIEIREHGEDAPVRVVACPSEAARSVSSDLDRALLQHREREVADALNLLYVAMTRPRHALHILLPARESAPNGQERSLPIRPDSLIRSVLGCIGDGPGDVLFERGDADWRSALAAPHGPTKQRPDKPMRPVLSPVTFAKSSRRRIWPDSAPSRLDEAGTATARDLLRLDTSAISHGVLIHAWFQGIEWLEHGVPDDEDLVRIGRIALPHEPESWIRARIPAFREMLTRQAVVRTFTKPPWPLSLWRERPFVARIGDALVRGRMDRVVIRLSDAPGPRVVITDIKSDQIGADAIQARAPGYYSQMRSYAQALSQMIGTPMRDISIQLLFVSPGVLHEVPLT